MPTASASPGPALRAGRATAREAGPRPRRSTPAPPAPRIRWERVGALALLLVALALAYLYLSAGIRMLSTWRQARHDSVVVAAMEREHVLLERRHEALGRRGTVEDEARQLGMIKPGEQPYIVTGLPAN